MPVLATFLVLQAMDFLSTLTFLRLGVAEANPLVRACLAACEHPAVSVAAPKLVAALLAWLAWRSGRVRVLRRVNVFYALCIAWNLVSILGAPARG